MKPLRHVIEDFFNAMSLTFAVNGHSVTGSAPNQITTITIDNILNLRAGLTVKIDGTDYTVLTVSGTTIFTVQANLNNPAIVILPRPIWFAGSPLSVNKKIDEIPTPQYKVPMVWLHEVIRERRIQTSDSTLEREAQIRLFFLDEADFSTWETSTNQATYYTKVIDGMDRLAEYMKEKMYNSMYFGKFEEYNITSFAKFGIYVDNKGVENSVFNDQLSGVELSMTLPVNKVLNC
jgi:hypothetical protein